MSAPRGRRPAGRSVRQDQGADVVELPGPRAPGSRQVPGASGWRYAPGEGVWRPRGEDGWAPVLDWCPEVTRHLVEYSARGEVVDRRVTLRVGDRTATVPMADVADGKVWTDRFPESAGVGTKVVREALRDLVDDQAAAQPLVSTHPRWEGDQNTGRLVLPPADVLPAGWTETAGTPDDFAALLRAVVDAPRVALVMGLAVGGLYVLPLRRQSYVVHLPGRGRTGKSTALVAAGAIFGYPGDPETPAGVVLPWNTTPGGPVAHLQRLATLTALRDELGASEFTPEKLSALVFRLTQGAERDQMGRDRKHRESAGSWHGALLSTGNESIVGRIANEGIAARVVEIAGPLTPTPELAERLVPLIASGYGHGLPALLDRAVSPATFGAWADLAARELAIASGGPERTLGRHLAMGVAGAILLGTTCGVSELADAALTAGREVLAELVDQLAERGSNPGDRLLLAITDDMASRPAHWPTRDGYAQTLGGLAGAAALRDVAGWDLTGEPGDHARWDVAVIPAELRGIAAGAGIEDVGAALTDLHRRGQLRPGEGQHRARRLRVGAKVYRAYVLAGVAPPDPEDQAEPAESPPPPSAPLDPAQLSIATGFPGLGTLGTLGTSQVRGPESVPTGRDSVGTQLGTRPAGAPADAGVSVSRDDLPAVPAGELRATFAVLDVDPAGGAGFVAWLPEGRAVRVPVAIEHAGDVAGLVPALQLGRKVDGRQSPDLGLVYVSRPAALRLGLPAGPAELGELGEDARVAHPFVTAAAGAGWTVSAGGGRGQLAARLWLSPPDVDPAAGYHPGRAELLVPHLTDAGCPLDVEDGRQLAADAALFAESTGGLPWAGGVSVRLMRESNYTRRSRRFFLDPPGDLPAAVVNIGDSEPFFWTAVRPLTAGERGRRFVHVLDVNGMFLSAAAGAELGIGEPIHAGGPPEWDRKRAGVWLARIRWPHRLQPDPFHNGQFGGVHLHPVTGQPEAQPPARWYSTASVDLAMRQDVAVDLLDAWLFPERLRYLSRNDQGGRGWYERLRDARTTLTAARDSAPAGPEREHFARVLTAVKETYAYGLGDLASWRRHDRADLMYRPHWAAEVRALARANLTRHLLDAGARGVFPFAVLQDAVMFAADDPNPAALGLPLDGQAGKFKVQATADLAAVLPLYEDGNVPAPAQLGAAVLGWEVTGDGTST